MEQAGGHYWMLMKGKQQMVMNNRSSSSASHFQDYHSWEERAFAEDAAHGALGGCMWPPRSYSCSFCKREFRSAQALGGHMNVHRRDRAKLRQSLSPLHHHQHHHQSPEPATNNPSSTIVSVASSSSPPTRVSAALSPSTWSSPGGGGGVRFVRRQEYSTRTSGHDDIGAHLSVGVKQASTGWPSSRAADDQSIMMGCKRPKLAVSSCFQAAEMIGFKPSSMEDLDLELRLGNDPPHVN